MSAHSYFIRLTPDCSADVNLDIVFKLFKNYDPTKLVVAVEQGTREHYHIAIWGVTRSSANLRANIKLHLDCQVYISGKDIENSVKAIAYCFKDGNYKYMGLNIDEFLQAVSVSKPKLKYDKILQEIDRDYDGDDKKYLSKVFQAHVDTNKKVYMQHIKAQLLLTKLKHDKYGTYKTYLIEKIIDNL